MMLDLSREVRLPAPPEDARWLKASTDRQARRGVGPAIGLSARIRASREDRRGNGWRKAPILEVPADQPLVLVPVPPRSAAAGAGAEMPKWWHLLAAICFGMPMASALPYAQVANASVTRYALVLVLSVMLGLAWAWALETARTTVGTRITRKSGSLPGWYSGALYCAAIVWMAIAWFLGLWLSSVVGGWSAEA